MPRCVYQGSMKITAIEKRKLSSKREDILDNTEPCQTKNTAQPVLLWTNNHGYLQAWKSRPIKRDYDHILKTLLTNYLQAYDINRCCM